MAVAISVGTMVGAPQAARAAPVTDYIAVSNNVMTGAPTTAANTLNTMAVGPSANAWGDNALAVGAGAGAARTGSTAVGSLSAALAVNSAVIGYGASTGFNADRAVSIGYMAAADGSDSLGLGSFSVAGGQRSLAFGFNAFTGSTAADSLALGSNSVVLVDNAVALGANAKADRANTVSVGNATLQRQIVNVAAGTANTDAVNVGQLRDAVSSGLADAVMYDSPAHDAVTLGGVAATAAVRLGNVANGAVDAASRDAINGSQLYGLSASVASALGGGASVSPDGTVVAPSYLVGGSVFRNVGDALGNLDTRVTTNTSAINDLNIALGNVINNGVEPRYFHANSTLADSLATGVESVAIGGGAQAAFSNSVALGSNAVADRANSVSVGSAGNERQITHVAAGTADTDAVNVAQLKQAGLVDGNGHMASAVVYDNAGGQVDYASVTLGQGVTGGTVIHNLANGVLAGDAVNLSQLNDALNSVINVQTGPTPFVSANGDAATEAASATGTHATAVGAAAVANGDQATAIGGGARSNAAAATAIGAQAVVSGTNASAFGAGSQAMAGGSVALGAGSVADRANTVSVGQAGSERQIVNVAPGTLGTDAVNLNQLNAAVDQTYQSINDLDRSTRKGIASASALQIVTPYLPGRTTLNAGVAGYRGQAAFGLGVSRWNEKGTINLNAGVASSGSNSTIVRAGIGIVLGN
ncbi:cell surface protein [Paraburkholderia caribensis MBA4]|uniref:Cell surface protein n=1 Tax=Paraburkholderia caribensis MBA4 TaxID=1323664 RepID=A0A0P0RBU2_9BURK|nr:YadA-like family protein [Paraburkholderia caribensis]ALL65742.1 cell surface protein [Paraburkholderia caribensis MBA4]